MKKLFTYVIKLKKYLKSGFKIKSFFTKWIEQYLFFPNPIQRLLSITLFPLTIVYCIITAFKRSTAKAKYFGIKVVSIGNLVLGGSGKTPVTIALAKKENKPAIVLRGYGRASKGMYLISKFGNILEDISISGDEAQEYAMKLPNACIIVCEKREEGIVKAKELGCEIVFLDDAYRHHNIGKFDILIRPDKEPTNIFCLPSGGYRETKMMYSFVPVVLKDGVDFIRKVTFLQNNNLISKLPSNIILLVGISKPSRLLKYLPSDIKMEIFPDHYSYKKEDIELIQNKYLNHTIITTQKDNVKLKQFNINDIIIMDLEVEIIKQFEYDFS